jgi:hypothetical protein
MGMSFPGRDESRGGLPLPQSFLTHITGFLRWQLVLHPKSVSGLPANERGISHPQGRGHSNAN